MTLHLNEAKGPSYLTDVELEVVAMEFGFTTQRCEDGSIAVCDVPPMGLLEKLLTPEWVRGEFASSRNQAALVWFDSALNGWKSFTVGDIGPAGMRAIPLLQGCEDNIVRLRSVPKNRIYLFFYEKSGAGSLKLCPPFVSEFFVMPRREWSDWQYASYKRALYGNGGGAAVTVAPDEATDYGRYLRLLTDFGIDHDFHWPPLDTHHSSQLDRLGSPSYAVRIYGPKSKIIYAGDVSMYMYFDADGKFIACIPVKN